MKIDKVSAGYLINYIVPQFQILSTFMDKDEIEHILAKQYLKLKKFGESEHSYAL
ncbi:hypothetical protein MIDIC_490034 [Alphaproteobacteria bacterium]